MSEWQEKRIDDIVKFQRGHDITVKEIMEGIYPVAGSNGIIGFHNQFTTKGPGITLGRSGNSIGVAHYYNSDFWAHNTTLYSKEFYESDAKFVYYLMHTIDFKTLNSGSAVPSLNRNHIHNIKLLIPPLPEQKAIASVLSSLEDKIDLLHRQNKTLEAMAETLFRQWFVEEADDGWEEKELCDIAKIGIGRTPPRKESQWFSNNQSDVKWISIKDMGNDGVYSLDSSEYLTKEAIKAFNIPMIPENTVLLSFKMTLGRVSITTEQMTSNEAIAHFILPTDSPISKEYLYLHLKTFPYQILGSTSSIVTSINSTMIKELPIFVPDQEKMKRFESITEDCFTKILQNQKQMNILETKRNILLPKLMSGEVKVVL